MFLNVKTFKKEYNRSFAFAMHKLLVIQTAFIGDVALATALVEKLHAYYPDAKIDFLLRKGNEALLIGHPHINELLIWDKSTNKQRNLLKMAMKVRSNRYSHVINAHRFASSGLFTFLSGAPFKAGFDKNPFSFCYTHKVKHIISEPYSTTIVHETQRNQKLIEPLTDSQPEMPKMYPTVADYERVKQYRQGQYACVAPTSVWFTKQYPADRWIDLINALPQACKVYILGGPGDKGVCDAIAAQTTHKGVLSLCGNLSFLQSAALMEGAAMNYTNDSGPLHFASAINAPVTAVFCSTVPAFGFGPLRANGRIVEIEEKLPCRPCGLHGHKKCPEGHFNCALKIKNEQLLWWTLKTM